MTKVLNKHSRSVTQPKSQGASQAMLHGVGLTEADLDKAQVGIVSMWYEGNPCNMHLKDLSEKVREGVLRANMIGLQFNTVGVSDALSMGTSGMSYSLPSRDLIADSIETVVGAQWYDAVVAIPGCDKNIPGVAIAIGRLNRPGLIIYGGTIMPGKNKAGEDIDIVSAFQSYGEHLSGKITEEERQHIVRHSIPGAGACGGMYTANTMSSAVEALGLSLPGSASSPAIHQEKINECLSTGIAIRNMLEAGITPRQIMTKAAFENAIVLTMVLGGSTNAVLHLIAMARAVDVEVSLEDFHRLSERIPVLADLKPSGRYVMADLHRIGGVPMVLKYLLKQGVINGDCLTVTGKTLAENYAKAPDFDPNQDVLKPWDNPIRHCSYTQILTGNLAPEGSVAKISGKEGEYFEGPARVFDSEEDMLTALENKQIKAGDVIIIRYEGPKGGPGMPEMLTPTSAIMGAGMGNDVALLTDGRFSGGSHGFIVGHITPEAQEGGTIALVEDGDVVSIDARKNSIDVKVESGELARRRQQWQAPPLKVNRGMLYKFIKSVKSASLGCVTDEV